MGGNGTKLPALSVVVFAAISIVFLMAAGGRAAITLDSSFGQNGLVVTDSGLGDDEALALAIQGDGKIVVAGYSSNGAVKVLTVARYEVDGTPDVDFAVNGLFTLSLGSGDTVAHSLALEDDGGMLVSGASSDDSSRLFVLRLTPEGYLDKAFADDGQMLFSFTEGEVKTSAVVASAEKKILLAGTIESAGVVSETFFTRLDNLGAVDESFGVEGKIILSPPEAIEIREMVLWAADVILAGGSMPEDGTTRAVVLSLQSNGNVADTFGQNGKVLLPVAGVESKINDLLVRDDGKILVAGFVNDGSYPKGFVAELEEDGSVASAFGVAGVVLSELSSENVLNALTLLPDRSLLATGFSSTPSGRDLIVMTVPAEEIGGTQDVSNQEDQQSATVSTILQNVASQEDVGNAVAISPAGQVFVSGFAKNANDRDLVLLRLAGSDLNEIKAVQTDDSGGGGSGYSIETEPVTEITRVTAVSGGTITELETQTCADICAAQCEGSTDETCIATCTVDCVPKPTITLKGVCFGTQKNPTYSSTEDAATNDTTTSTNPIFPQAGSVFSDYRRSGHTEDGPGTGKYVSNIDDIYPAMTYYARAFAVLSDDTVIYGNEVTFKTDDACFIATATYGSILAKNVVILREFRDRYLMPDRLGQRLVGMYYRYSPPIAGYIEKNPGVKAALRVALLPVIAVAFLLLKTTTTLKYLLLGGACLLLLVLRRIHINSMEAHD